MNLRLLFSTLVTAITLLLIWQLLSIEPYQYEVEAPPIPSVTPPDLSIADITIPTDDDSSCEPQIVTNVPYKEGIVGVPEYPIPVLYSSNPVDEELVNLLFDGLLQLDHLGRPQPQLAESWVITDKGTTITMSLKKDVKWHDGRPFTAEDVLFTVELLQSGKLPNGVPEPWADVQVEAPDDHTIVFTLQESYSPFFEAATVGILPKHLLQAVAPHRLANSFFNERPIGTGPFKVTNKWYDGYVSLEPHLSWWESSQSNLSAVEIYFYPTHEERMAAYSLGEIQGFTQVAYDEIDTLPTTDTVHWYNSADSRYLSLMFNVTESSLSAIQSKLVRQSLVEAIDKSILLRVINGQGIPFDGPFPVNSWAYHPDTPTYSFNPISATAKLDETIWLYPEDGGETRIRTFVAEDDSSGAEEGELFQLRFIIPDAPSHLRTIAERLQEQWQAIGVNVELTALSAEAYATALTEREFDLVLADISPLADPDLYDFWSQDAIFFGQNYAGWNNATASQALELGRQTWTIDERLPHYDRFTRYFQSELPAFSLFQYVKTYVIDKQVATAPLGPITQPRDRFDMFPQWVLVDANQTDCEEGQEE